MQTHTLRLRNHVYWECIKWKGTTTPTLIQKCVRIHTSRSTDLPSFPLLLSDFTGRSWLPVLLLKLQVLVWSHFLLIQKAGGVKVAFFTNKLHTQTPPILESINQSSFFKYYSILYIYLKKSKHYLNQAKKKNPQYFLSPVMFSSQRQHSVVITNVQ